MISSKLDPNILPKQTGGLKAELTFHRVTFAPSSAKPGERLPHTLALRFDLNIQPDTADGRYCVNNIARNIVSRMEVKVCRRNPNGLEQIRSLSHLR